MPVSDRPKNPDPPTEEVKLKHQVDAFVQDATTEHVHRIPVESTIWDVYNNEARKVDTEMVNDWRESLNSLLLFAAIFAAVLTAFIIESKKMLEQDQTQLLVNVTVWNINNNGNQSNLPYSPPDFESTLTAVSINCLLFASLGASLVAALASVVSLQWVADYDAAITRGGSSAEDRAKRRQFRFGGVINWGMGEMIATLPLLLYSSVALFWAGAIQWMWTLHPIVGYVVAGGTAVAMLFYVSTTLLAATCVSAPFRTPLSRAIYWVYQLFVVIISRLSAIISAIISTIISAIISAIINSKFVLNILTGVTTVLGLAIAVPLAIALAIGMVVAFVIAGISILPLTIVVAVVVMAAWPFRHSLNNLRCHAVLKWSRIKEFYKTWIRHRTVSWIKNHIALWISNYIALLTNVRRLPTARQREDTAANDDPTLEQKSLIWLAHHLPVSMDSAYRLDLLFTSVLDKFPNSEHSSLLLEEPWPSIFEPLSRRYLRQILDSTLPGDKHRHVGIMLSCIERLKASHKVTHSLSYEKDTSDHKYWSQCCFNAEDLTSPRIISSETMAFLLTRDVPIPSLDAVNELRATISLIRWRNLEGRKKLDAWIEIFADQRLYSAKYLDSCLGIFKTFIEHIRTTQDEKLLPAQEPEGRRYRMMEAIDVAARSMLKDDTKYSHYSVVGPMCQAMKQPGQKWPCSPDCPEDVCEWVANIQDPCLAIIAGYACGVPVSVDVTMTYAYKSKYSYSVETVQKLLYRKFSRRDPEIAWRLRAGNIGGESKAIEQLCLSAFKDPNNLTYLQRIFEHPTDCHDHSQGPHHLLFHLHSAGPMAWGNHEAPVILGDVVLIERRFSPILLLLAFSDSQYPPYPFSLWQGNTTCIRRIQKMCKAVKQHPASIYALLTDIVVAQRSDVRRPQDMALVLELVEQAMRQPDVGDFTYWSRPLAQAITALRQLIRKHPPWHFQRKAMDDKLVRGHAKRIARILCTSSASRIITSSSHLQMLCCARGDSSTPPAIGWLPIYVEL